MKLSILIPVYNDKDYIKQTIDQIRAVQFPIPYEIVAVDDASTDGSREILESIPDITKIFHKKNTGKGGAIATGLTHVTGDIIAIQDDDCEYDPAALPLLIDPIIQGNADVVYGSRFLQKNAMFFIQRMENIAITALASLLVGHKLTDIETGHKVFTREMAQKVVLTKKGFEFDMEITLQFLRNGARIKELPTKYIARTHAQGKKITYKDGISSIITLFRHTLAADTTKIPPVKRIKRYLVTLGFLAAVFLPRLIGLGNVLTVDEPLWLSRGQTFINALSVGKFDKTLVAGQPGITTAWLVGLSTPWKSLAAAQAAIGLATGILILINTYFFRMLFGKKWGTITGLFLALDPFLIAHSRVAHTDALLALFYLSSLSALLSGLLQSSVTRRYIAMSAMLGAGAILTKIFGIILIPTTLFIILILLRKHKHRVSQIVRTAGLWLSVCFLTFFMAWPALWFHSGQVRDLLLSRASLHAEGTRAEETTSTQWYYARETLFRLSVPVTILLPFTIWQWKYSRKSKHATVTLLLVASGVFLALILNTGSDKSDRYILFTHITLVTAAPLGLAGIINAMKKYPKEWASIVLAIPIIYLTGDNIRLHPYYLAHYNRLYPIEHDHKLGWGEGLEQAASWIEQEHPGAKVFVYYPRVFSYFYKGEVETIGHIDDASGDYAVLYRSMFERGEEANETDIVREYQKKTPAHVITINGLEYAWIFPLGQK
jgi:glycosyltransferase involved in cell wall biosynthesis